MEASSIKSIYIFPTGRYKH